MFIAEIGINYAFGKDKKKFLQNVFSMIDMVCLACEVAHFPKEEMVVKFQKRTPEYCIPEHQKNKVKEVPWEESPITYIQYKEDIELWQKDFEEIVGYCRKKGIKWTASVWDETSARFIAKFNVPFVKIPSAMITNKKLVQLCGELFKKVIFSTGMSTEQEIIDCYNWLMKDKEPEDITIMHCNSSYPAADNELDLYNIKKLEVDYAGCTIGYSGHEEGISASIVAATLGAEVMERHVTLSRSNWGTDQAASLVYDQLYRLLRDLKKVPLWLGNAIKQVYPSEEKIKDKLRGNE